MNEEDTKKKGTHHRLCRSDAESGGNEVRIQYKRIVPATYEFKNIDEAKDSQLAQ